jgi:hypothetical protein
VILLAPTLVELAPDRLADAVRARFGSELRRVGAFTQICQLGASACLDAAASAGRLGVLLGTVGGAVSATRAALGEPLRRGEPSMPFTFIATQTHLSGALLAHRSHEVARAACVYLEAQDWPWLLRLGESWLGECERVAVGCVEEAADGRPHRSQWCLLVRQAAAGILCRPGGAGAAATTDDWIARVAAGAQELRGGRESWRFTSHRGA